MKRPVIAFVAALSVIVAAVLVLNLRSEPVHYSCPTRADRYSRSCADASRSCQEDHGVGGGAADGAGFSYVWKCDDGVLTSFTFPG